MESVASAVGSLFMVFGPVIGYVSQYNEIKKRKNASGFSTLVSLILLLSNILRCFFWLGKSFDVTLVYQAIVMIFAQLIMLHLCVSLGDGKIGGIGDEGFYDSKTFKKRGFWKWTDFSYYIYFLIGFSGIVLVITTILGSSPTYFEFIGFLSLSIESMLGVPQLIKNHTSKSTQGLSVTMIATWFIGDAFKTVYFAFTGAPAQFLMCGALQLIVDSLILAQIAVYKPASKM
eukprot:Phypoly_transcript_11539.p1 GENE.Phypoly_transcript_11539~~Phypoly_transcript_11539.p1  ORF type:complete len:231 (+),score=29.56 Phypoly_transcript_11539:492-1184(+)